MGLSARPIPAVLLCMVVIAQLAPCASGENDNDTKAPVHPRTVPLAPSLCVTAAFDAPFYLPTTEVTIAGRVTDHDGYGVGNARVAAELWGGPSVGTTVTDTMGNYSLVLLAPKTPGNYSVNVTADKDGLSARTEPILRVAAEPNSPPKISRVSQAPQNVTPVDDVLVSADAFDDHGVKNITLAYIPQDGTPRRVQMNATGPDRYTSSIPRQPVNCTVDYYIEAWDGALTAYYPPGAPAQAASYTVVPGASGREWVRLVASLNLTECLVDWQILATGYIRNETGGPVANARLVLTFEGPAASGDFEATTDDRGVFWMEAAAPAIPGNYTVRIGCEFGALSNSTSVALRVRDVLTVTVYTSSASVEATGKLVVSGAVTRNDGSAASGAVVRVMFEGSKFGWDCRTDALGAYNVTVRAPGNSGSYMLNATATFAGMDGSAGMRLAVLDRPKQAPGDSGILLMAAAAGVLGLYRFGKRRPT